MKIENKALFETMPVRRAMLTLVIPTILSQLINVIYNMTDTYFIGQLNDPVQVAATTIAMPLFVLTVSIASLFGVGGASLISRSLGEKKLDKARSTASFCLLSGIALAGLYGILIYALTPILLPIIGADKITFPYCASYIFWTVVIGSVPLTFNPICAQLIRTEGYAAEASFGMILGSVMNMLLDPLFIFGFGLEMKGAAIATLISVSCSSLYNLYILYRNHKTSVISLNPKYFRMGNGIAREVFWVGLPSCLLNWMATASNIVMNILISSYSTVAIAGMGIAKRIDILAFAIATGISQGVLPLIGYNFAARNFERMKAAILTTVKFSIFISCIATFYLFFGASSIAGFFIEDIATVQHGQKFLKIICITTPFLSITLIVISVFQAIGSKVKLMILSLIRKGGIDIPLMFILNYAMGLSGILWAFPIEDIAATLIALIMIRPLLNHPERLTVSPKK